MILFMFDPGNRSNATVCVAKVGGGADYSVYAHVKNCIHDM